MASLGWEDEDTVCPHPECAGMLRLKSNERPYPPHSLTCDSDPAHAWHEVPSSGPYGRFVS